MPASRAASEKDEKLRETPGRSSEKVVNATSSVPKNAARTAAPAALNVLWPDVYSGNGGVTRSGVHSASFTVSSRGSRSPLRIAVIGRQKWKVRSEERRVGKEGRSGGARERDKKDRRKRA